MIPTVVKGPRLILTPWVLSCAPNAPYARVFLHLHQGWELNSQPHAHKQNTTASEQPQ